MANKRRLKKIINQIIREPDSWSQDTWHNCGTAHCVAGWADVFSGAFNAKVKKMYTEMAELDKTDYCDMSDKQKKKISLFEYRAETFEQGISKRAQEWLDLTDAEAHYLFAATRTFTELYEAVARVDRGDGLLPHMPHDLYSLNPRAEAKPSAFWEL